MEISEDLLERSTNWIVKRKKWSHSFISDDNA